MIFFTENLLSKYMENDKILDLLTKYEGPLYTSHRWMLTSIAKRMIYYYTYGDFLKLDDSYSRRLKILDVGGGYCSITENLLERHNYTLLDIMTHDKDFERNYLIKKDWYTINTNDINNFDIIIANDLFPNVDQRLDLFIDKFFSKTKELRLVLTYYNIPKFYTVKRIDADEIFTYLTWNGNQIKRVLDKYYNYIVNPDINRLEKAETSLFSNKRQVCLVTLKEKVE